MANGPEFWQTNRTLFPNRPATPTLLSVNAVLDSSDNTVVEYAHNHAALEFFEPSTSDDFSEATHAHIEARQTLQRNLARDEFASIEAVDSIHDLHSIASKAQELSQRRSRWSRGRAVLLALDRYKCVLDILAQPHAECTSLAWGTIKWILTVAVNYINLLQRISGMLEDIAYRLPRFQLYQDLLPSKRSACIISKLYAAIIGFLTQTILFFNKSKARRLFPVFSGSLQTNFQTTLDRIERLSGWVEEDARAAALASQQAANAALSLQLQEVKLITRHAMQSVLEVKHLHAKYLLQGARTDLFHGLDGDLIFQSDILKLWTTLIGPGWTPWYQVEIFHVPFYLQNQTSFAYVQTEQLQVLTPLNIMLQKRCRSDCASQIYMCWSHSMTAETAMASLIYQALEKYPEKLLFREDPNHYAYKIRCGSRKFESLVEIYLQIITALQGSISIIFIPLGNLEAADFILRMTELSRYWSPGLHCMLIYHVTDPDLSDGPRVLELDNEFDIDSGLDTTENFFRILMMFLGVFGTLTDDAQTSLWSGLWRSLRYGLIVITFDLVLAEVNVHISTKTEHDAGLDSRRLAEASLKRKIISFFQSVERDMPDSCRQDLVRIIDNTRSTEVLEGTAEVHPLTPHQRDVIWAATKKIFAELITKNFLCVVRDQLSAMEATCRQSDQARGLSDTLQAVEGIFSPIEWHEDYLMAALREIRETLQRAAAHGMKQIIEMRTKDLDVEQNDA